MEANAAADAKEIKFFDSVTGELLFIAPRGRSMDAFLKNHVHTAGHLFATVRFILKMCASFRTEKLCRQRERI